ncbi:ATP-binding protein [Kitasatospora sp. NPDC003701]
MPGIPLPSTPVVLAPTPPGVPEVPSHWRFPAELASVRRARRAVAGAIPEPHEPQLFDVLRLVTSELVTNAIRHGARADEDELIELVLWIADGHCWLAVSDPGAGRPVLVEPNPQECGGRGLLLVDAVCDIWAVVPRRTCGKSVVAGVRLRSA